MIEAVNKAFNVDDRRVYPGDLCAGGGSAELWTIVRAGRVPNLSSAFSSAVVDFRSEHLHVLSDAGLVRRYRRGRQRIWVLEPGRLGDALGDLDRIGARWEAALERLQGFLEDDRLPIHHSEFRIQGRVP